ncbi:MAG: hypothetical protein K6G48_02640 [Acholeplasmatales bacterium]|nr:hypothetical protein [Acholeplasmatales bacterium]
MDYLVTKALPKGTTELGKIVYNNLQDCMDNVEEGARVYLKNEVYYGKVYIRQKNITIIGMDDSIISYDAYNGMKRRPEDNGDGVKVYGTTGSATVTVKPEASGLKMFNVTIQNTHAHSKGVDARNNGDQAVAFKTEAFNGYFEECKFIGYQDTLYTCGNDNVFNKCFIAGTVDFIFGSGNTIFDKCIINCRCKDNFMTFLCAPNTRTTNTLGLFFYKCMISSNGVNEFNGIGRPWYDTGTKEGVVPRCLFYKCQFPSNLALELRKMNKFDGDNAEMYWYECTKNGEVVSNTDDTKLIDFYLKMYEQRR